MAGLKTTPEPTQIRATWATIVNKVLTTMPTKRMALPSCQDFKKSVSEGGLRTITGWDQPYGKCIDKWRLVCIMQRKNGVPNLYASENTIPAMTG